VRSSDTKEGNTKEGNTEEGNTKEGKTKEDASSAPQVLQHQHRIVQPNTLTGQHQQQTEGIDFLRVDTGASLPHASLTLTGGEGEEGREGGGAGQDEEIEKREEESTGGKGWGVGDIRNSGNDWAEVVLAVARKGRRVRGVDVWEGGVGGADECWGQGLRLIRANSVGRIPVCDITGRAAAKGP